MGTLASMSLAVLAVCVIADCLLCSASLVNDVFPGPLIQGNKVNFLGRFLNYLSKPHSSG